MYAVDRILHLLVIALADNLDPLSQVAATDLPENAVAFANGQQDRVEHRVHALDQFAVIAFEPLHPPALAETAFARGLHQPENFLLKLIRFWPVQNSRTG